MRRYTTLLAVTSVIALTGRADAQSFNIDYYDGAGVPSSSYAAGASQPGVWNNLFGPQGGGEPLVDIHGAETDALAALFNVTSRTTLFNPMLSGDDAALFRDNVMTSNDNMWMTFHNLLPGTYEIYTYYLFPSPVRVWTATDTSTAVWVSGTWTGEFIEGQTHTKHIYELDEGEILQVNMSGDGDIFFNGLQLKLVPSPGGATSLLLAGACLLRRRR